MCIPKRLTYRNSGPLSLSLPWLFWELLLLMIVFYCASMEDCDDMLLQNAMGKVIVYQRVYQGGNTKSIKHAERFGRASENKL
jgi:hypothetical protein